MASKVTAAEFTDLLKILAEDQNIRVCVKETLKGGVIAGIATVCGGLALGPFGLAAGGAIGGITAALLAKGKFVSLTAVLNELENKHKERILAAGQSLLNSLDYKDFFTLQKLVMGDPEIKQKMLHMLLDHVKSDMRLEIVD